MKFLAFIFSILIATFPAVAQIELVGDNYFPAEHEFEELQSVASETRFSDSSKLAEIENGSLIAEVGFDHYAKRSYNAGDSGTLSIEILTLIDSRAAFSLLTLLRTSEIHEGPPGDAFAHGPDGILFCHGRRWVRILGNGVPETLLLRVAGSVSNRIGTPEKRLPSLISLFPETKSFNSFYKKNPDSIIHISPDMEIARSRYKVHKQSGILTLLKFPTHQVAEEYFAELSAVASSHETDIRVYFRRIGPLIGVLEGSFNATSANQILSPIQYSYSVQWIYNKYSKSATVWGIPVTILGSTVLAFFIVVLACSLSILAGFGLAACRLLLRRLIPKNPLDNPKRTEITRLKLQ